MMGGRAFVGPLPFDLGSNINGTDYGIDTTGLSVAQSIGMRWNRDELPWNFVKPGGITGFETVAGTYLQSTATALASSAAATKSHGMNHLVVVTVNANPGLTSTWTSGPPTTPTQFASAMAWIVAQPGLQGLHWELFNEPDASAWGITPALLTQAFQLAYPAMKSADPTCVVHASATENFSLINGGQGIQYLNSCYAALPTWFDYYDVGGLHSYTPNSSYTANIAPNAVGAYGVPYWQGVANFQAARIAAGDTKPLWITECGFQTTDGSGPQSQAQWYQDLLLSISGHDPINNVAYSSYLKCVIQFAMEGGGANWQINAEPAVGILTSLVRGH
jgi:hypothetical protein